MRKMILVIGLVLLAVPLYAQQDLDDPGIQDSIIVGIGGYDPLYPLIRVPIYAVTDDSVSYYNIPLTWRIISGSIRGDGVGQYFLPITSWDLTYDTVLSSPDCFRIFGFRDLQPDSIDYSLHTNRRRCHIMTLYFTSLEQYTRAAIDTTYDTRNGSLLLGLDDGTTEITPAFVPGHIGVYVGIGESDPISAFSLSQNYPNPFNPSTNIAFTLPLEGKASLVIYDLLGREVRTLLEERLAAGSYTVAWNGRDNNNQDVPSGTYFYRLTTEGFVDTKRMTLIR